MDIRRFRHFTSIKCNFIFTLGLGLVWAFVNFWIPAVTDEYYEWGEEEGEIRFVERELALLEAGRGGSGLLEWWTDQDEREKTFQQLEVIIADHEASERVSELQAYLKDPESAEMIFSEEEQKVQLQRSFMAEFLWFFALGVGVIAIWMVRKDWKASGDFWRVTGSWSPWTVLALFFLAELLIESFVYDTVGTWLYLILGDEWGGLLSSLVWRGAPGVLAAFALYGSWRGVGKAFGLKKPIRWFAVIGVFGVVVLYDWLQQGMGGVSEAIDSSDFLMIADPSGWDLFFDVMDGVVFAPVFEEVMYRGVLFLAVVKRWGAIPAALVSSFLFAIVHTQYDSWELVSVGVFGLACCWLTWRTGSIKSSIVLHIIYNGLITVSVYLLYQMPL